MRDQQARQVDELAALLGWSRAEVMRQAAREGSLRHGNIILWQDAAGWLLEAWPIATVLTILGPDVHLLPIGLHPRPLVVAQPAYVVHGLRIQWQVEPMPHRVVRPATFADYLTDILHGAINPATVELLQRDLEFMRAYDFPSAGGGE